MPGVAPAFPSDTPDGGGIPRMIKSLVNTGRDSMERIFSNPANGHTETVSGESWLAMLLLGALYLAYKGLWGHFSIWMLLVVGFSVLTGGPGILIALPLASIGYAIGIKNILANSYLRRGWVEVSEGSPSVQVSDLRDCPFCAEPIKNAAIKCKHCGTDVEAVASPLLTSGWVASIPCMVGTTQDRARLAITNLGMPIATMPGSAVGVGPFASKDEAKRAQSLLRDEQKTYSEIIYRDSTCDKLKPGDITTASWALAIPCRKETDRERATTTAEHLGLPFLSDSDSYIKFGPFLSKAETGEVLRLFAEKDVHGNIEEIRKP